MMTSHDTVKCRRSSWPQRPIVMTTMSIFASPASVALGTEARSELLKSRGAGTDRRTANLDAADAGVRAGDLRALR